VCSRESGWSTARADFRDSGVDQRSTVRAIAAAAGLRLSDEDVDRVLPWFQDLCSRSDELSNVGESIPRNVEPPPWQLAWMLEAQGSSWNEQGD
jgi:hypothetical protein